MKFDLNTYIFDADGSVRDVDGNTIFFSFERFKKEICKKGSCFVCGEPPSRSFNNEHVFPNWVLKRCQIHNENLSLPNGGKVKYGTYKIPCCQSCNSRLADIYEKPISAVVNAGYDKLMEYVREGGFQLVSCWLSLIFLKVHLRDFKNRISLDERSDNETIGDRYELNELHHIHAVARAASAGIHVDESVFGTLVILQIAKPENGFAFDYCDSLAGRTLLIQVNDLALIYVLDDCGATGSMLSEQLKKIPEPLSKIQLREIYARHAAANIHIKNNPKFLTNFIGKEGKPQITVQLPDFSTNDYDPELFGYILAEALKQYSENITVDGKIGSEAFEIISTGRVSFLFDEHGNIKNTPT